MFYQHDGVGSNELSGRRVTSSETSKKLQYEDIEKPRTDTLRKDFVILQLY